MSTKPTPEQVERIRYYQFMFGMSEIGAWELVAYEDDESHTFEQMVNKQREMLRELIERNVARKVAEGIGKKKC